MAKKRYSLFLKRYFILFWAEMDRLEVLVMGSGSDKSGKCELSIIYYQDTGLKCSDCAI